MLHTKRFLVTSWAILAFLFGVFACWAFYVQTVNENPLLPAFIALAASGGASFVAWRLHSATYGSAPFRNALMGASILLLPLGLVFLRLGQADDSPGAGGVGILFMLFGALGIFTSVRSAGTGSAKSASNTSSSS